MKLRDLLMAADMSFGPYIMIQDGELDVDRRQLYFGEITNVPRDLGGCVVRKWRVIYPSQGHAVLGVAVDCGADDYTFESKSRKSRIRSKRFSESSRSSGRRVKLSEWDFDDTDRQKISQAMKSRTIRSKLDEIENDVFGDGIYTMGGIDHEINDVVCKVYDVTEVPVNPDVWAITVHANIKWDLDEYDVVGTLETFNIYYDTRTDRIIPEKEAYKFKENYRRTRRRR